MEAKSGVKTSEFWTAVLVFLANGVPAVLLALKDQPWAAAVFGGLSVALPVFYVWGRAVLKAEQAKQSDVIPDAWEPTIDKVLGIAETLANAMPKAEAKKEE